MTVTSSDLKQRARDALDYFLEVYGEPGEYVKSDPQATRDKSEFPEWVLRIEEAARSETDATWEDEDFYGLVAETLQDLIDYGEHRWDEEGLAPEELVDEVATDFSVPTLNVELYEWTRHSEEWSDVSRELEDGGDDAGDVQLEMMQEAMGEDVYFLRQAVLSTLLEELQVEEARDDET